MRKVVRQCVRSGILAMWAAECRDGIRRECRFLPLSGFCAAPNCMVVTRLELHKAGRVLGFISGDLNLEGLGAKLMGMEALKPNLGFELGPRGVAGPICRH